MTPSIEMPKYRSHKEVWALKIKEVKPLPWFDKNGNEGPSNFAHYWHLVFEDPLYAPKEVDYAWVSKHNPKPGGYYVVYKDGYTSYSPAEAFEEGYTMITHRMQDDAGHWYWIPSHRKDEFRTDLGRIEGKVYMDCPDDFDRFIEKWDDYATGGSPDSVPAIFEK